VSLPPILLVALVAAPPAAPTIAIKVDQVGYGAGEPKVAFVVVDPPAFRFTLRRTPSGAVVFEGELPPPAMDADSGDRAQTADFSKVRETGDFYLEVPGVGRSWDFAIGPRPYGRALYLAMRSFYGQRCGTAVDLGPEFPGYSHAPCHLVGGFHPSSGKTGPRPSVKGWHDAGDYGRYVVNSGITTGTLLWAWELYGRSLRSLDLHIPESGNGTPDILNEVRWNLEWMLSMQDDDGGVWHKQTSERFCGFVMPEQDAMPSLVIGTGKAPYKSSCATADLAAVSAIAARTYRSFDPAFADKAMVAARKGWDWVEKNPDVTFRNPEGVTTGEYGNGDCSDERLWAASELWRTTSDRRYESYFLQNLDSHLATLGAASPEGWGQMAPMALWTYVLGGGRGAAADSIRERSLRAADDVVARSAANGYRVSLTAKDYVWGSNGVAANYGMQLLVANALRPDRRYVEAALDDLHYLLGRNTFSLSWLTWVGQHAFRHPHHRPSGADANAEPWPGLLSGGPNRNRQDPATKKLPSGLPPARMYLDEEESYATNENCLNWNAPLVFLLAGVQAQP
jgi:endoglucanase